MILSPDFTKTEDCCRVENDARIVYKTGQVLSFTSPVYGDTLEIALLGTGNATKVFVRGVDWDITNDDLDEDTLSRLKLEQPAFDEEIIKSIRIIREVYEGTQYTLALQYQRVYPIRARQILLHNEPIVFDADLARDMLEDIRYLKALTHPVTNITGIPQLPSPKLMEEDPHGENVDNVVENEIHAINVPNNKMYLHPIAGAFFKDSMVVKQHIYLHENTNIPDEIVTLKEGKDYQIVGLDRAKTATTSNASGVYHFVIFTTEIVGDVSISYRAYGGDPTLYDQRAMSETINAIVSHLAEINALTPSTLNQAPVFQALSHEVFHLREDMRRLTKEGNANYGDLTSGQTLKKKLIANDNDTHWWTIAQLYTVDTTSGSSEVMTAGEFTFRLESMYKKLMFTCAVDVNLQREDRVMEVSIINDCCPKGFTPFKDYSNLDLIPRPQLRVIFNQNDQMNSGVYLQLGMKLIGTYEEIIAVEDISGKESCWKLVNVTDDDDSSSANYQDDIVTLPNDAHVWDKLNPDSKWESTLVPFKKGHLVWAGSEYVNRPHIGKVSLTLDHFLDDDIDIKSIKKARAEFSETGGNKFSQEITFIDGTEDKIGSTSFVYNGSSAYVNIFIKRNVETEHLVITIEVNTDAGLAANALSLRHVFLFT